MKCSVFGGHGHSHGVSGPCHSHGGQDAHSAAAVPLARDAHAPSQVCSQNLMQSQVCLLAQSQVCRLLSIAISFNFGFMCFNGFKNKSLKL